MKRLHQTTADTTNNWDLIIIGGGATGLGIAIDAVSRGFKTLLVEQSDFAKGTSSRSTKLIHGGVRYLAQGNIRLVQHALKERGLLLKNAAHLVHKTRFIIPCYSWFSLIKYFAGLTIYDWLAGQYSFGKSARHSKKETMMQMPGIKQKGLKGSISYFDGQFDDARLAVNMAQTAQELGASLLTYTKVTGLIRAPEKGITGIETEDIITGNRATYKGKVVINATGIFVDDILKMNDPLTPGMVRPSQGIHLVFNKSFLNTAHALMIPKTTDGRVLFAVPWHGHLLVGTTDTPVKEHLLEPRALKQEVDFILRTAATYFIHPPTEKDILCVFSGLRPLAALTGNNQKTKEISRDHKLLVSAKGLITITGGKWTTYRRMAQETVDLAIQHAKLEYRACITQDLPIHGNCRVNQYADLDVYGTDRTEIEKLRTTHPALAEKLHPDFPYIAAEVVWAARNEMAETVEDILSRRLRILFTDAKAAMLMAPKVAQLLATELQADQIWINDQLHAFNQLAKHYLYQNEHQEE